MPLYRGFFNKKGPAIPEPVEPTRRITRSEPAEKVRPSPPLPSTPSAAPTPTPLPTEPPSAPLPVEPSPVLAPTTRTATSPITEPLNALPGPVVGWLAIIAGPGRGEILRLGYGVNDIGSGPKARVRLNFGDTAIAADNHAAIIYTTRSRRFYLAQSATAETRLNNQLVCESVELSGGETVQLGQTQMRFVPLCGPDFDWRDSH